MENKIIVKPRSVVVPGETLARGMDFLPGKGTYREGEEILSSLLGLADIKGNVLKIIPLSGAYIPKKDDNVIGRIKDVGYGAWDVDINAPVTGNLMLQDATMGYVKRDSVDIRRFFDIGDYIFAKVIKVSKSMYIMLSTKEREYRKLGLGLIFKIKPVKVPRVIGKKGSMVNLLKNETGTELIIGQNGVVWIHGKNRKDELLAKKAIKYIEEHAHETGLTDKIKELITEWKKNDSK
jgi:exosome complex component RRP4